VGDRWGEATIYWKRAQTETRAIAGGVDGDVDRMLADYAAAAQRFADMGGRPFEARVMRDWGEALIKLSRRSEAEEKLRAACALFGEMGLAREADEISRELAA
jgi:hypothetical protein